MSAARTPDRSFEILIREHHRRALAYAMSLVRREDAAQDIVQDAFVTVYQKLDDFDTSRDFGNWLCGIVRLKYLEWTRSHREQPFDEQTLDALEYRFQAWDDSAADGRKDMLEALGECLRKLKDAVKQTVELFYMKRVPCRDIAEQLSTSESAVKKRLDRARDMLQDCVLRRMKAETAAGC